MAICPAGHESASDDFCDVCGLSIGAPPLSSIDAGVGLAAPAPAGAAGTGATVAAPAGALCPQCGSPRTGQFCEDCGFNFAGAAPAPAAAPVAHEEGPALVQGNGTAGAAGSWSAVVTADRDYFDSVQVASGPTAGIGFPAYCPERRFRLSGHEVRIGRRSASRGLEPEIDLTGPPSDPGISRLHAVLIAAPDGSWSVLDPGSANGTLVNGTEIRPDQPVPLSDGDRINLGAWTLVTISRD
ncbi:MAG: FHA domain-containing protein [Trebonia sp.]